MRVPTIAVMGQIVTREKDQRREGSGEAPSPRRMVSRWRYGRETVVPSPLLLMVKVPEALAV
jgi:hypothetical protein